MGQTEQLNEKSLELVRQEANWEHQAKMPERKEIAIRLMGEKLICIH